MKRSMVDDNQHSRRGRKKCGPAGSAVAQGEGEVAVVVGLMMMKMGGDDCVIGDTWMVSCGSEVVQSR